MTRLYRFESVVFTGMRLVMPVTTAGNVSPEDWAAQVFWQLSL
jgi:hypothetical protein